MSKFFETTIVSTYIKYLLENNPLPLYPVINTNQIIVEGCTYIYRHNIIKCTKTGIFKGLNANIYTDDYLYVNEQLLATDDDEVLERRSTDWIPIYKDKKLVGYEPSIGEARSTITDVATSSIVLTDTDKRVNLVNKTLVVDTDFLYKLASIVVYKKVVVNTETDIRGYQIVSQGHEEKDKSVSVNLLNGMITFNRADSFFVENNIIDISYVQTKEVSKKLYPLTVTDDFVRYVHQPLATFDILGDYEFGQSIPNFTKTFVSNVNYYDSYTHKELGEYLRCLRDIKDLDLMGLYNCFDYEIATNISLTNDVGEGNVVRVSNPKSKLIIVPIKFNRTYTIAIDCMFPVLITPIFYNGRQLVKDSDNTYLGKYLNLEVSQYYSLQYHEPITYKVDNDPTISMQSKDDSDIVNKTASLQKYEKYLYLAIELPASNDSTITVLEGNYSTVADSYISSGRNIDKLSQPQISRMFQSRLSLLDTNDNQQHPYSDKLINYLCRYTIDNREYIDDNVANVEKAVGYNPPLKNFYPGMWDTDLRYALYNNYMELENEAWINKYDILGFVDNDLENAINRGSLHILTPEEKGLTPLE